MDDDIHLMLRARNGDDQAFDEVQRRHTLGMRNFFVGVGCPGSLLEDLVQEVFARAYKYREKYQPTSTVKSFLRSFARRIWQEQQRFVKRQTAAYQQVRLITNPYDHRSEPGAVLERRELLEAIKRFKSKLSDKQRQAVELVFESGLSHAEAAKRAGCSYSTFRRRFHDAKKQLRDLLGPTYAP